MAGYQCFPLHPNPQRDWYGLRLDHRAIRYEDMRRLEGQERLQLLVVELENPEAERASPGYIAFTNLLKDPNELKGMREFHLRGLFPYAPPVAEQFFVLPHEVLMALTPRNLASVTLVKTALPVFEFRHFLEHCNVEHLKLCHVEWESDSDGPLISNCKLRRLDLNVVPHDMIAKLIHGIPEGHKLQLEVSGDGKNGQFSQLLWNSICVENHQSVEPKLRGINSIIFRRSPRFIGPLTIWRDLEQSQLEHLGIDDAAFGDQNFAGYCGCISRPASKLRSLYVRFWNPWTDGDDVPNIHQLMESIKNGSVVEYVHIGVSCAMTHIIASHIPFLGLSAAHFEIVQEKPERADPRNLLVRLFKGKSYVSPLDRSPGPELIEAARRDKTLGVFAPDRAAEARKRGVKGLSAIGVKQREYECTHNSDGSSVFWTVFSEDDVDLLRLLEARNIRRARRRPLLRDYDDEYYLLDEDVDSDHESDTGSDEED